MPPRLIIFCGPSGAGKSTLIKQLFKQFPDSFGFSCSHTSRSPRQGETNGKEYHFSTKKEILEMVANGLFVEHAEFAGNIYGTSNQAVRAVLDAGRNVILDIDMQGVIQLKKRLEDSNNSIDSLPLYLFISPPSLQSLETRLRERGTETENSLKSRLNASQTEMKWGSESGLIDHIIINDKLDDAYKHLVDILKTEHVVE